MSIEACVANAQTSTMKSEAAILVACIELVAVAMCVAVVAPVGSSRWSHWNYGQNVNGVHVQKGKYSCNWV